MENLVKRAKAGDKDAFTKLMDQQMQSMYKTAYAILYNTEDAADAISDTILACWEKIGQLKSDRYFRTWMTRILINKCRDIIQKREHLCLTETVPEIPAMDEGFLNAEWKEELMKLDEKYRLVVILYYVEGFRAAEIGRMLGITGSTVRTQLARAREKLAQSYNAKLERKCYL